jgi:hypothetical protein
MRKLGREVIGDTCAPRQCSKETPRQPKLTGGTDYEKMNVVVRDSMIGYVFKEKTACARPTMGGGVDVAPRLSGVPPPHPQRGVHKTPPNMTNKNHSKTYFFMAKYVCS